MQSSHRNRAILGDGNIKWLLIGMGSQLQQTVLTNTRTPQPTHPHADVDVHPYGDPLYVAGRRCTQLHKKYDHTRSPKYDFSLNLQGMKNSSCAFQVSLLALLFDF